MKYIDWDAVTIAVFIVAIGTVFAIGIATSHKKDMYKLKHKDCLIEKVKK